MRLKRLLEFTSILKTSKSGLKICRLLIMIIKIIIIHRHFIVIPLLIFSLCEGIGRGGVKSFGLGSAGDALIRDRRIFRTSGCGLAG